MSAWVLPVVVCVIFAAVLGRAERFVERAASRRPIRVRGGPLIIWIVGAFLDTRLVGLFVPMSS